MKKNFNIHLVASTLLVVNLSLVLFTGCVGKIDFLGKKAIPTKIQEINDIIDDGIHQDIPADFFDGIHPVFSGALGIPVSSLSMSAVSPDPSGLTIDNDYDGDGLPNDAEILTNPYVSDYPKIVTRISTPITMEIRVNENDQSQNHTEIIDESDVKNTISNSMEDRHYSQLNLKTTPYVTKEQHDWSAKRADSTTTSFGSSGTVGFIPSAPGVSASSNFSISKSFELALSQSDMSEKTVFDNINYIDNLDRNGVAFTDDTIKRITRDYRQSEISKSDFVVEPNAGLVRAGLYIKNDSIDMPVHVSNVVCTLSFRTPSGKILPVKTFILRNDDYSEFNYDIYGGEEFGPFTIEVPNLNTFEVKKALANGYIPQIHIIDYELNRVDDTNYSPGVDNLKIVEETAKSRTATIKISGPNMREQYRVVAFDKDGEEYAPGISLKKALFYIFRDRIGNGESWDIDSNEDILTVPDTGLKWKASFAGTDDSQYAYSSNDIGNSWNQFETYVKIYDNIETDDLGRIITNKRKIETIKRIGRISKYNPFTTDDNKSYNSTQLLKEEEFMKMKYWVILHNGRYFDGDINDPIWAGERYEIVLFDAADFNGYYAMSYNYTPIQSGEELLFDTRWNRMTNDGDFVRAVNLGKIVRGDVIKLQVDLEDYRALFNESDAGNEFGNYMKLDNVMGNVWQDFKYTFDTGDPGVTGMPGDFQFNAWGECNSITVKIDPASNAAYYSISFSELDGVNEINTRTVEASTQQLAVNNGYVTIHRKTKNKIENGSENGEIVGAAADGGKKYRVRIKVHGYLHNVPVEKLSATVYKDVKVTIPTGETGTVFPPQAFQFKTQGSQNAIDVLITQAANAEYYLVDIKGPYNYGHDPEDEEHIARKRFVGVPGINRYTIPNLTPADKGSGLTSEEESGEAPGVYKIMVYAVNDYSIDDTDTEIEGTPPENKCAIIPAANEKQVVDVNYLRFSEYRTLGPKRQVANFDPKDVDVEVNFNDGSGWFRLRLSHDDKAVDDRVINCQYTTNFDQYRQRVNIYFTAPTGYGEGEEGTYNIFRGGREEADLFLRTTAEPQYRDNLWLKPNRDDMYDSNSTSDMDLTTARIININSDINNLPDYDAVKYWLENENTDATLIDDYTRYGPRVKENYMMIDGTVPENDFNVVCNGKEDFFFSPMRYMIYRISASLADVDLDNMANEQTHVDNPKYRAIGGDRKIYLSNLDTQYGTTLQVYWKRSDIYTSSSAPMNQYPWATSGPLTVEQELNHSYPIENMFILDSNNQPVLQDFLIPNTEYTVCVLATNNGSTSSKVIKKVKTVPEVDKHELDDPMYLLYGYGRFYEPPKPLTSAAGNILLNKINFKYGEPIIGNTDERFNIYDLSSIEEPFVNGKYVRIVNNGVNIALNEGLGLTPYAMDLDTSATPPSGYCYIDPIRGDFMLPRPAYWSRMEDWDNLNGRSDIHEVAPKTVKEITDDPSGSFKSASHAEGFESYPDTYTSFNKCFKHTWVGSGWYVGNSAKSRGSRVIFPFGNTERDISKGTLSFWGTMKNEKLADELGGLCGGHSYVEWRLISDRLQVRFYSYLDNTQTNETRTGMKAEILYEGSRIAGPIDIDVHTGSGNKTDYDWHHFYIIWDKDTIVGGKTLIIYVDNVEKLYITNALPDYLDNNLSPYFEIFGDAYGFGATAGYWPFKGSFAAYSWVDNIKWFNDVVSDHGIPADAGWEYDTGAIYHKDSALHPVYGPDNYFRPMLQGTGNGVGFYCIPNWGN